MRKEVFLSILIGLIAGLIITYSIYRSKSTPPTQIQDSISVEKLTVINNKDESNEAIEQELIIHQPENGSIQQEDSTRISGMANPDSFVVIFNDIQSTVVQADKSGSFSKEIGLNHRANVINVYNLKNEGQHLHQRKSVFVYPKDILSIQAQSSTTSSLTPNKPLINSPNLIPQAYAVIDADQDSHSDDESEPTESISTTATSSNDTKSQDSDDDQKVSPTPDEETTNTLRERIEKVFDEKQDEIEDKIEVMSQAKRAYIAQITRVTEEAITLESSEEKKIIPLTPDLELIEDDEAIEIEDLIVDSWVVALGVLTAEDQLKTKKIIVANDDINPPPLYAEIGTIEEITSTSITFNPRNSETSDKLLFSSSILYEDAENEEITKDLIEKNMQCIVTGYTKDNDKIINLIHLLAPINKNR